MLKSQRSGQLAVKEEKIQSRILLPEQLRMIEEALCEVGEFGEVRLVVEKGRLRFVIVQKSYDALNWGAQAFAREK